MPQRRRVPVGKERSTSVPAVDTADDGPITDVCECPRLDAEEWQDVENDWADIAFLKMGLTAVLGVPLGYYSLRTKLFARAEANNLDVPEDAMVLLGSGRFRRSVLLEVESPAEGNKSRLFRPGGIAYTRIAFAPPGKVKAAVNDAKARATRRYGKGPDRIWLWFLTCRFCSAERNFETLVVAHYKSVPSR